MAVTITTDDNFFLYIADGGGTYSFRIKYGTSPTEVCNLGSDGVLTLTGELKAENTISLESRSSGDIIEFKSHTGTVVAYIDAVGRCVLAGSRGVALKVETSVPIDTPLEGTTRVLVDATPNPDEYSIIGYVGGAWRKLSLPN